MAKPKFHVQHFVVCPRVTVGHAEPGNPYTLHDVKYTFDFAADREFPVIEPELWLFVRIVFASAGEQDFVVRLFWLDGLEGEEETGFYTLPPLSSTGNDLVISRAWKLSFVRFPSPGRYAFRLSVHPRSRVLAQEYIEVRTQP